MFSTIMQKIKEMLSKMFGMNQTIEQTLHIAPAISNKMAEAIDEWTLMYEDKAEWLHEPSASDPTMIVSLGLPAFIASEKARMAVIELKSEITAPKQTEETDNPDYFPPTIDEFGNPRVSGSPKKIYTETTIGPTERADYLNKEYHDKLLSRIRTQLEYGIAKGSLIIKPYIVKQKVSEVAGVEDENAEDKYVMEFDFVQADCFYPFSFDSSGKLLEVAFIQTKYDKDKVYTRLEYHKLEGNSVRIINKAFENTANQQDTGTNSVGEHSLGKEIPLTSIPEWKSLPPTVVVKNVDRLLFGYFKMPDANIIDPHSPLGMSGFGRARTLIREADKQYSRLLWEYQAGEMAIDIDRDALSQVADQNGNMHYTNPVLQQRLFRTIDLGESDTYKPFTPALRDASLVNGLNTILMRIEDVCSLSRGTVSDISAEARTATEIRTLKQRTHMSNVEIQKALELALRDVIYTMDIYCTIYNIVGDCPKGGDGKVDTSKIGQHEVSFTWDDSILVDAETEMNNRLALMNSGIASKLETRMWYYGETEKQARDAMEKIAEESQAAIERNMAISSQMGKQFQGNKDGSNPSENGAESTNKEETSQNSGAMQQAQKQILPQSQQQVGGSTLDSTNL